MRKSDLQSLEATIMKEVVKRRQLGGYSADAEGILILTETLFRVLQHIIETYPEDEKPRRKKNDTSKTGS